VRLVLTAKPLAVPLFGRDRPAWPFHYRLFT
jgi:hypothetical protein